MQGPCTNDQRAILREAMMERSDSPSDDILDAAARLFRAHGLGGTSIRAIAEAAGVLPGSLTYRYPTKDDLVLALMERAVRTLERRIREVIRSTDDPLVRLREAMRAHMRVLLGGDDSVFVLLFEFPRTSPATQTALHKRRKAYNGLWDGLLFAAVGGGQLLPDLDLSIVRRHMLGSLNSVAFWYDPTGQYRPEQVADMHYGAFMVGFLQPAARPDEVSEFCARHGLLDAGLSRAAHDVRPEQDSTRDGGTS